MRTYIEKELKLKHIREINALADEIIKEIRGIKSFSDFSKISKIKPKKYDNKIVSIDGISTIVEGRGLIGKLFGKEVAEVFCSSIYSKDCGYGVVILNNWYEVDVKRAVDRINKQRVDDEIIKFFYPAPKGPGADA